MLMKKKIAKLGIMCLVAGALLLPKESHARDTDYTTGADFSWSPYTWSLGAYEAYSDPSQIVGYLNNVKFSSSAADEHNSAYYLTFEINNTTDNVPHSGWFASNLPGASFDTDDDDGDGKAEEAEAYEDLDGTIYAGTGYYFQTSWKNSTNKSGKMDYIIQRSVWNPFNGEMEAYHYDYLNSYYWSN
jgi:hypothetical protein